jgi:hypothetical protein
MKSPSLETLYADLHRSILLVQSYTDVPELAFIIKSCRLKPYSYFFEGKTNKITLHSWWFDEFGNSLKLKNKKIKIVYGDLLLDRRKIICTDLYAGLSLDKVIKMSKFAQIISGRDEDIYQDCLILSLLGIDNYLRTFLYLYGEWQQVSPLTIGLKNLKTIVNHHDIQYFRDLTIKENNPLPCMEARVWLTCLPSKKDLLDLLDKQCGIAYAILRD